jgi:hypothetical protein
LKRLGFPGLKDKKYGLNLFLWLKAVEMNLDTTDTAETNSAKRRKIAKSDDEKNKDQGEAKDADGFSSLSGTGPLPLVLFSRTFVNIIGSSICRVFRTVRS